MSEREELAAYARSVDAGPLEYQYLERKEKLHRLCLVWTRAWALLSEASCRLQKKEQVTDVQYLDCCRKFDSGCPRLAVGRGDRYDTLSVRQCANLA